MQARESAESRANNQPAERAADATRRRRRRRIRIALLSLGSLLLVGGGVAVALVLLLLNGPLPPVTGAAYAQNPTGDVLFMRHALAPGGGDPAGFTLEQCSTQRNLDGAGRQQAAEIGIKLASLGLAVFPTIYTSQWCRCRDTAVLIAAEFNNASSTTSFHVAPEWGPGLLTQGGRAPLHPPCGPLAARQPENSHPLSVACARDLMEVTYTVGPPG